MDTNRLKRFATEARNILMQGVKNRLQAIGFDLKTGTSSEMPQKMEGGAVFMGDTVTTDFYSRWMSLYNNIHARGIKQVAEEAAYTWFNRFIAIRIMQKQGFISPVLAYESEEGRVPVIVSEARQGRMPQMPADVREKLVELLEDDGKTNEQFALLIVAYCHENPIINQCFGRIADYTELLLPHNVLVEGGFVSMLNRMSSERNDELAQSLPSREGGRQNVNRMSSERNDELAQSLPSREGGRLKVNHTEFITDDDFRSAELIGWLYQFYIADRKAEAFAKKGKYDVDEIAPATQIFTPNWIVKYMVENTLGRIYIDNNPYCEVKNDLHYLVDAPQGDDPLQVDDLSELTVADLACGSGHILNECFDLLYQLYIEEGYSRTQAITHILRKNLLGIDLDTRAKQLATFAILMKACQKDDTFLDGRVMPRIYDMPRPLAEMLVAEGDERPAEEYLRDVLPHYLLGGNTDMVKELTDAILLMNHADTLGSIMRFDLAEQTRNAIMVRTEEYEKLLAKGEVVPADVLLLMPYMRIILALTQQYAALCMNPPYMGSGRFDTVLSKYVKKHYEEGKADLFSVFMLMGMERLAPNGKMAQINMQSWMFLSSFEKLRKQLLDNYNIDSMLHLGPRTFDELSGEVVQNTSFVISKHAPTPQGGTYYRLVDGKNCADKEQLFLSHIHGNEDGNRIYYPNVAQKNFEKIPGEPIGYWVSEEVQRTFDNSSLGDFSQVKIGMGTGKNDIFLRKWWSINYSKINSTLIGTHQLSTAEGKYFPYNKGGEYRLWYGNIQDVVWFDKEGRELMNSMSGHRENGAWNHYFKSGITWSFISTGRVGVRFLPNGCLFDVAGSSLFSTDAPLLYILGLLSTKVAYMILKILNPTINFQAGNIKNIPLILKNEQCVESQVRQNISLSKQDWDAHETSWDFEENPLVALANPQVKEEGKSVRMEDLVAEFEADWTEKFMQLHANEEQLNREFISIYGLEDELSPDVPLSEITILQQGEVTIEQE